MLIMKRFKMNETRDDKPYMNISPFSLSNFNLHIGDNAQGKTKFFNLLRFLKDVHTQKERPLVTKFSSSIVFEDKEECLEFTYKLKVYSGKSDPNKLNFEENIFDTNKIIFSRKEKKLLDEKKGEYIKDFYIPPYSSAIASLAEPQFITINKIRKFFENMYFLESNRFSPKSITVDEKTMIPDSQGSNIGSVLSNWQERYRPGYNEVIEEFKSSFRFIKDISVIEQDFGPIRGKILTSVEDGINYKVHQLEWSDGMIRTLCLLALPVINTNLTGKGKLIPPSLICIDEIENGLDYKTLKYIINYYLDHKDFSQIIIATHSPLVCNFVSPIYWRVFRRKGTKISVVLPGEDKDLQKKLEMMKQRNWDFYRRHISQASKLISVK